MRFDDGKTEALNLRVSPTFKAALKELAERENRSMVNMLEVLVMERMELNNQHSVAKLKSVGRDAGRQP